MKGGWHIDKRLYRRALFIGVLLALSIFGGVACDAGTATPTETVTKTDTETSTVTNSTVAATETEDETDCPDPYLYRIVSPPAYFGVASLEETILLSDIIAVVDLNSVDRGVGAWKQDDIEVVYSKTLEFTFEVEEYLKGRGESQVVGLVFDSTHLFSTRHCANLVGIKPDPDRLEHWDDRKAVIFLRDDAKDSHFNWEAGHYYMGLTSEWNGNGYSIVSRHYRPWLPAVKDDERRFLLETDFGPSPPQTITLDNLNVRILALDQEIAGRSDEYKDCVLSNYRWQREIRHRKESLGGEYYYNRSVTTFGSGIPAGTKVFTDPWVEFVTHAYTAPEKPGDYVLAGRDQQYFLGVWPGEIFVARPLPQGEYRIYHAYLPYQMIPCGATVPEDEMRQHELLATVDAPEGTLHEAFFDPVENGKTVVGGGANGVLKPATFSDANGASATIQRIAWDPGIGHTGMVKLKLTPHNSIAGHTVDFIGMDGSVALSLAVADATVDEAKRTLRWKVESQPWQDGDKLMLRISASVS